MHDGHVGHPVAVTVAVFLNSRLRNWPVSFTRNIVSTYTITTLFGSKWTNALGNTASFEAVVSG